MPERPRQKPALAVFAPDTMSQGFFTLLAPRRANRKWFCIHRPAMVSLIDSPVNCGSTLNRTSFIGTFPIWVGAKPPGPVFLVPGIWALAFSRSTHRVGLTRY